MKSHKNLKKLLGNFASLFFVSFSYLSLAQNSTPSSLEDWFKASWEHSPEIKSSEAQVQVVESNKMLANSLFMPSLFARYQFRENERSAQTKVLSLNAEQNFFNGMSDYHRGVEANRLLEAEQSALKYKKMSVARIVGDTLLKIAATTAQRKILDENSKILEERLKEFRRRTRIGRSRDVDLIQNQIDRLQLERLKATNQRSYLSAVAVLKEYTGKDISTLPFDISKLLNELISYHSGLEKRSYRREELRSRTEAQESAVSSSYGGYFPTVKGVASYYPENDSSFSRYNDDWSVGVDLEWRFFEGFSNKAQVNQERALQIKAQSELQSFEYDDVEATQRLKDEWKQLTAEKRLVSEAEALSVKAFNAQERDFRLGLVTVLELSTSDEQYLNLKLEKIAIQEKLGLILTQAIERGGLDGLQL